MGWDGGVIVSIVGFLFVCLFDSWLVSLVDHGVLRGVCLLFGRLSSHLRASDVAIDGRLGGCQRRGHCRARDQTRQSHQGR